LPSSSAILSLLFCLAPFLVFPAHILVCLISLLVSSFLCGYLINCFVCVWGGGYCPILMLTLAILTLFYPTVPLGTPARPCMVRSNMVLSCRRRSVEPWRSATVTWQKSALSQQGGFTRCLVPNFHFFLTVFVLGFALFFALFFHGARTALACIASRWFPITNLDLPWTLAELYSKCVQVCGFACLCARGEGVCKGERASGRAWTHVCVGRVGMVERVCEHV
jgi:hypothetical protein